MNEFNLFYKIRSYNNIYCPPPSHRFVFKFTVISFHIYINKIDTYVAVMSEKQSLVVTIRMMDIHKYFCYKYLHFVFIEAKLQLNFVHTVYEFMVIMLLH